MVTLAFVLTSVERLLSSANKICAGPQGGELLVLGTVRRQALLSTTVRWDAVLQFDAGQNPKLQ